MSKSSNNNLSEYGKILADNLSLLRRNGSPQEFEKSLNDLIGSLEKRFQENQSNILDYQNDLLDIEKAYKPDDDRIFGSKETVSAEIGRNLKDSTGLNKVLTSLKTLSNDISQKKDVGASIDQFRANIGASPEVKPNFFARVQTFFANLFTDNKNQQKNSAQENLKNAMSSVLASGDQVMASMKQKIAIFKEQNLQQDNELAQQAIEPNLSAGLGSPPPSDLPPSLPHEAASQNISSPDEVNRANDLPPPPYIGASASNLPSYEESQAQGVGAAAADIPQPTDLPPSLSPEFGGLPTDLPPSPNLDSQPVLERDDIPVDLPPPPPPFQSTDPLSQELTEPARDSKKGLSDVLEQHNLNDITREYDRGLDTDQATEKASGVSQTIESNNPLDVPSPPPPPPLEQVSPRVEKQALNVGRAKDNTNRSSDVQDSIASAMFKRRGGIAGDDDLDPEIDEEFDDVPPVSTVNKTSEVVEKPKGVIPPPPINKGVNVPPPPPGPMPIKPRENIAQDVSKSGPKPDLMGQIRGGFQLKKAAERETSLDQGDFKYTEIQKHTGLRAQLGNEYDAPALVNNKTKEQQMNVLYSAVVGGLTKVIKELAAITVQVNTGKTEYDDFEEKDVPIMEARKVYSKEDFEKVYEAANNLASDKEKLSHVQKENLKKGIEEVGKSAGIETNKGVGR